jgi:hypothetical protein
MHQAMQRNAIQRNTMQCNAIQCNAMQCNTMQYNAIQYNTIQYNAIQYNAIQYNTMQYNAPRNTSRNASRNASLTPTHQHRARHVHTRLVGCPAQPARPRRRAPRARLARPEAACVVYVEQAHVVGVDGRLGRGCVPEERECVRVLLLVAAQKLLRSCLEAAQTLPRSCLEAAKNLPRSCVRVRSWSAARRGCVHSLGSRFQLFPVFIRKTGGPTPPGRPRDEGVRIERARSTAWRALHCETLTFFNQTPTHKHTTQHTHTQPRHSNSNSNIGFPAKTSSSHSTTT